MRESTTAQSTLVAVVLVALALGAVIAPVGAGATGDARPSAPAEAVASTAATPPNASLVARYPADGSMVERTVVTADDVARVDPPVNDSRTGAWTVAMALTEAGAANFTETLVDAGFADNPNSCPPGDGRNDEGYCLLLVVDGDAVDSFGLAPGLAQDVRSGAFAEDPRLQLLAENHSEARAIWRGFLDDDGARNGTGTTGTITDDGGTDGADASNGGSDTVEGTDGDSSGATPGFALPSAIAALLAAIAGLARRR